MCIFKRVAFGVRQTSLASSQRHNKYSRVCIRLSQLPILVCSHMERERERERDYNAFASQQV